MKISRYYSHKSADTKFNEGETHNCEHIIISVGVMDGNYSIKQKYNEGKKKCLEYGACL